MNPVIKAYMLLQKVLVSPVWLPELFKTALQAVWEEQHAPFIQFLPAPAWKKSNATNTMRKIVLKL